MSHSFETLILDVSEGIATITLNRPERMNAFTGTMGQELMAAFDQTDADDAVRAVIVTGAGRAFCAGADLAAGGATFDRAAQGEAADTQHRDMGGRVTLRIFESLKPVIGAVNGAAVGIGATMQLPMDVRLASDGARYGFVFARRGIVPEAASSWFLPRLVGISRAAEWCYSGRVFGAEEARQAGLVRDVLSADELLPAARALAHELTDHSAPVSVAVTRQMLWRMLGADHPMEAHRLDSRAIAARGASDDAREGVVSFLEKRDAHYPCRVSTDMPDVFAHLPRKVFS